MNWDTKKFPEMLHTLYGREQLEKVKIPLNLLFWKFMLSEYHSEESKRIYGSYLSGKREGFVEATIYAFLAAAGSEEAEKFNEARILAEAHVIAYAQALHSTADILSQIIYHGLDLEHERTDPLDYSQISLNKVYNKMTHEGLGDNVTDVISELKESPEFRYLEAYVNTTKHRSLVDTSHRVSFQTKRYGIEILSFEYKGEIFPEKWADDFVTDGFEKMQKKLITVGDEMNHYLGGKV